MWFAYNTCLQWFIKSIYIINNIIYFFVFFFVITTTYLLALEYQLESIVGGVSSHVKQEGTWWRQWPWCSIYEYYELINTCNNRSQLQQLVVVETTIADARILSGGERSGGNATVDTFAVIIWRPAREWNKMRVQRALIRANQPDAGCWGNRTRKKPVCTGSHAAAASHEQRSWPGLFMRQ